MNSRSASAGYCVRALDIFLTPPCVCHFTYHLPFRRRGLSVFALTTVMLSYRPPLSETDAFTSHLLKPTC
jgi:hypothetical protein